METKRLSSPSSHSAFRDLVLYLLLIPATFWMIAVTASHIVSAKPIAARVAIRLIEFCVGILGVAYAAPHGMQLWHAQPVLSCLVWCVLIPSLWIVYDAISCLVQDK